jgi:glc operon protein GlcG
LPNGWDGAPSRPRLRGVRPTGSDATRACRSGWSLLPSPQDLGFWYAALFNNKEETMLARFCLIPLLAVAATAFATQASADAAMIREQKVISSAGARAMVDACTTWAERNNLVLAMSVLDWAGNLIESHAMEGAAANAIDTALLKAKSALRWRRPTSETNRIVRSGENLAPTFMHDFPQPGALPIIVDGQVIGAMGVSSGNGEKCAQAAIDAVFKKQGTPPAP